MKRSSDTPRLSPGIPWAQGRYRTSCTTVGVALLVACFGIGETRGWTDRTRSQLVRDAARLMPRSRIVKLQQKFCEQKSFPYPLNFLLVCFLSYFS